MMTIRFLGRSKQTLLLGAIQFGMMFIPAAAAEDSPQSNAEDVAALLWDTLIGVWVSGILVAAMIVFPGLAPSKALGAMGIASIAVGFAFKDIFENFFAGVLILLVATFVACEQEGPAEKAGEKIDEAAEEAAEKVEEAGDALEETADEVEEKAEEAAN